MAYHAVAVAFATSLDRLSSMSSRFRSWSADSKASPPFDSRSMYSIVKPGGDDRRPPLRSVFGTTHGSPWKPQRKYGRGRVQERCPHRAETLDEQRLSRVFFEEVVMWWRLMALERS